MPPYTTGAYIKEDRRGDQNPNYYVYSADDRSRAAHPATQLPGAAAPSRADVIHGSVV